MWISTVSEVLLIMKKIFLLIHEIATKINIILTPLFPPAKLFAAVSQNLHNASMKNQASVIRNLAFPHIFFSQPPQQSAVRG